ncbi:hypothetical protein K432DRAFT_359258 [Lepidopterella palustris CBS 459.81]|uniref:U6 snRNA phosphodiesterase n=1 Tax=Lepidopterella palustris CBS 459.81 TaxID=1314670 RepID=A0A8E2E472_9PEZI|nr:hypothetical protein K432DRAFT_359258 [Lepidopterella palustris CBS 459.81]
MPLVQYPDSSSEDDSKGITVEELSQLSSATPTSALKRKRIELDQSSSELPPLPASFYDLYSTNARTSTRDDPSLHGGRKRAVPHVEGNWATHVYLEWHPSQTESTALHTIISLVQSRTEPSAGASPSPQIHPLFLSSLGVPLPLHISISRPLILRAPQRDPFLATLSTYLRKSAVRPFEIVFTTLKWVPNFERTRWFLVLGIARPTNDELNRLLQACNQAAEVFGLPRLYTGDGDTRHEKQNSQPQDLSSSFHISIAWTLAEPLPETHALLTSDPVARFVDTDVRKLEVGFEAVKVKIGNVVSTVGLGLRPKSEIGGILG